VQKAENNAHRRGVGPMTITMLLQNTLDAWRKRMGAV